MASFSLKSFGTLPQKPALKYLQLPSICQPSMTNLKMNLLRKRRRKGKKSASQTNNEEWLKIIETLLLLFLKAIFLARFSDYSSPWGILHFLWKTVVWGIAYNLGDKLYVTFLYRIWWLSLLLPRKSIGYFRGIAWRQVVIPQIGIPSLLWRSII